MQALSLAKECYSMKLELLTNATVVDDAMRFVLEKQHSKQRLKISTDQDNEEESKEPDYNNNEEEEGEDKQEEELGELATTTTTTINQIF
jgi:hypothetical protein